MNFKDNAFELYNELVQIRRKFRMYPELSFQEYRTVSYTHLDVYKRQEWI